MSEVKMKFAMPTKEERDGWPMWKSSLHAACWINYEANPRNRVTIFPHDVLRLFEENARLSNDGTGSAESGSRQKER